MRGLEVRRLQIFENGRGIYVNWDIVAPFASYGWNVAWRYPEDNPSQQNLGNDGNHGKGEDPCRGDSGSICRLKSFFRDPKEFFQNYW